MRRGSDGGLAVLRHLQAVSPPSQAAPSHPPVPRTSAERLSQPDVVPTPFPESFVAVADLQNAPPTPATVLYLAYGSNLCAETFLGRRGIRPLSQVNVSAPSLRLIFDLPGLPYLEPCFANTAPRKLPGNPPKLPPGIPDVPDVPPFHPPPRNAFKRNAAGDPVWTGPLIGVVYEVTREDFAKIIATEGGGASYTEILVPCLPLPARVSVPEKPPGPDLPRPFVARTLFAPRLPDVPDADEDEDDPETPPPAPPSWFRRLLLPVRRPDPEYAQPSPRYLKLITDGAREHELPDEYQEYLQALGGYRATTWRQKIGRVLFYGFWWPLFVVVIFGSRVFADDKGKVPPWVAAATTVMFNLVWMSYDGVAESIFGDGERTVEGDGEGKERRRASSRRYSQLRGGGGQLVDEEKTGLLDRGVSQDGR
ncbi:hypothetical protein QBC39DRAFT_253796 [Podospora conica]|nr:hypothetical protein QBC39DRAFT_253796 [Schizothecium conicum]